MVDVADGADVNGDQADKTVDTAADATSGDELPGDIAPVVIG